MNEEVVELASNSRGEFRTPLIQLPSLFLHRSHFLKTYSIQSVIYEINKTRQETWQDLNHLSSKVTRVS